MANGYVENEARTLLAGFLHEAGTPGDNFNIFIKPFVNREVSLTIGARLNNTEYAWSVARKERRFVDSVLAAELFPDRNPPEILVAESESETHDTLRERHSQTHPKTEPRISGDVVDFKGIKFFKLDISTGSNLLFTKTDLRGVVEILLGRGFIPVNALFELIPPEK